jgi:hypothetical protein
MTPNCIKTLGEKYAEITNISRCTEAQTKAKHNIEATLLVYRCASNLY